MGNMIRIQFELPEEKVRELENIMKRAGISTKKDLLNNSLTLFEWAVSERGLGNTIVSIDNRNKRIKELVMPSLSSIKPLLRSESEVEIPGVDMEGDVESIQPRPELLETAVTGR